MYLQTDDWNLKAEKLHELLNHAIKDFKFILKNYGNGYKYDKDYCCHYIKTNTGYSIYYDLTGAVIIKTLQAPIKIKLRADNFCERLGDKLRALRLLSIGELHLAFYIFYRCSSYGEIEKKLARLKKPIKSKIYKNIDDAHKIIKIYSSLRDSLKRMDY